MECTEFELVLHFYEVSDVVIECNDGDTNAGTLYYELPKPTKHTKWGVELVPSSYSLVVAHRSEGSKEYLPITLEEKIVGVDHEGKFVVIQIQSTTESKFEYTILLDCTSQHFSIVPFLINIHNTLFESMKKDIEKQ